MKTKNEKWKQTLFLTGPKTQPGRYLLFHFETKQKYFLLAYGSKKKLAIRSNRAHVMRALMHISGYSISAYCRQQFQSKYVLKFWEE